MKKTLALPGLFFLLSSPVWPQIPVANQKALAITHVTVIDTAGGPPRPDVTVLIRGDRIAETDKSGKVRVLAGSHIMDATGKFLIPGLWDMHFHWYDKEYLPLTIANGVTGVRVMLGYAEHYQWRKEIEAGQLLGPRMVIASRALDGPIKSAIFPGPSSTVVANAAEAREAVANAQEHGADFVKIVSSLSRDAFFAIADEANKRGIPFVGHVPFSVSVEEASNAGVHSIEHLTALEHLTGMLDACSSREVDLLKLWREALAKVVASGQTDSALTQGSGFRARMQLALDTYDEQKAQALAAVLKTNHTWLCPTFTVMRYEVFFADPSFAADSRLKYMPAEGRWWLDDRKDRLSDTKPEDTTIWKSVYNKDVKLVATMRRAGVEFLAGTDTANAFCFPGFSLHDELGLLVQAGLTPLESLQTATLNPARFLGRERDFGTVEVGKVADLVLLDANPLEDISNTRKIAAVVYRGKFFPGASLDRMLAKIQALARRKDIADALEPTIKERGVEAAIRQYRELRAAQPDSYDFGDIYALSGLGRDLLKAKKIMDAIQIFKLNAEAFPSSWWAYDDLGDAYMAAGKKELAIKSFNKSQQLDPLYQYATSRVKELNSQ